MSHGFVKYAVYGGELSLITYPRIVSWYLDVMSRPIASVIRDGLILRLARVFASLFTSYVIDLSALGIPA